MPYNFNSEDLDYIIPNDDKNNNKIISFRELDLNNDKRWAGIHRNYNIDDVKKLSSSIKIEYTLAKNGALKLWDLLNTEDFLPTLGTYTGNMAIQQAIAGLKAIYVSGWQVAADANLSGDIYPDQSLYPANSVPEIVSRINKAFLRADLIQNMELHQKSIENKKIDYFLPIIADAEAGF